MSPKEKDPKLKTPKGVTASKKAAKKSTSQDPTAKRATSNKKGPSKKKQSKSILSTAENSTPNLEGTVAKEEAPRAKRGRPKKNKNPADPILKTPVPEEPVVVPVSIPTTIPKETPKLGNNVGLFVRISAFMLDVIVLLIFNIVVVSYQIAAIIHNFLYPVNGVAGSGILAIEDTYRLFSTAISLAVINWLYFAIGESSPLRQTLGMFICNISTHGWRSKRVTFLQANFRLLGRILSLLTIGIGFFSLLFDRRRLALQDRLSRTRVVHGR